MKDMAREVILGTSKKLAANYGAQDILDTSLKANLPDREVVYSIIDDLSKITFPGYFGAEKFLSGESYAEGILVSLYEKLKSQIKMTLYGRGSKEEINKQAEELTLKFMEQIPKVQDLLMKDVDAQLAGDPAAGSKDEVILAYQYEVMARDYEITDIAMSTEN